MSPTRAVLLTCLVAVTCASALAQQGANQAAPDVGDEIIVQGRTFGQLRLEIQRAEEALYERFNAINSKDEYDITCDYEKLTGSKIPRRVCRANFWRTTEARASHETVLGMQGSSAFGAQQFEAQALYKQSLLAEEMRRLAATDPELQQAAFKLGTLQQALAQGRLPMPATSGTQERVVTSDNGQPLPYGAVSVADVHIGPDAWSHRLTRRIFTIANVFGELRSLEVRCRKRQTERLTWEVGVEWRLPQDWTDCTLRVEAPPGTTFALYEFE